MSCCVASPMAEIGQQETLDHAAYIVDNRSPFREQ
jgi:hypothetical protein